jgi:hypothetical protein
MESRFKFVSGIPFTKTYPADVDAIILDFLHPKQVLAISEFKTTNFGEQVYFKIPALNKKAASYAVLLENFQQTITQLGTTCDVPNTNQQPIHKLYSSLCVQFKSLLWDKIQQDLKNPDEKENPIIRDCIMHYCHENESKIQLDTFASYPGKGYIIRWFLEYEKYDSTILYRALLNAISAQYPLEILHRIIQKMEERCVDTQDLQITCKALAHPDQQVFFAILADRYVSPDISKVVSQLLLMDKKNFDERFIIAGKLMALIKRGVKIRLDAIHLYVNILIQRAGTIKALQELYIYLRDENFFSCEATVKASFILRIQKEIYIFFSKKIRLQVKNNDIEDYYPAYAEQQIILQSPVFLALESSEYKKNLASYLNEAIFPCLQEFISKKEVIPLDECYQIYQHHINKAYLNPQSILVESNLGIQSNLPSQPMEIERKREEKKDIKPKNNRMNFFACCSRPAPVRSEPYVPLPRLLLEEKIPQAHYSKQKQQFIEYIQEIVVNYFLSFSVLQNFSEQKKLHLFYKQCTEAFEHDLFSEKHNKQGVNRIYRRRLEFRLHEMNDEFNNGHRLSMR